MTETTSIAFPAPEPITEQLHPLELKVAQLTIADKESHAVGLELGKSLNRVRKFVQQLYEDPKRIAHEAHSKMVAAEKKWLQPVDKAKSLLDGKLSNYERQERERAEKEARDREAEASRIEQERQLAEAVAAEEAGDTQLADSIMAQEPERAVIVATPELADVKGAASQTRWSAEVVDFAALVKYVAEHPEHRELLQPNDTALNGVARALKANMRIPGVRAISKTVRAYRD